VVELHAYALPGPWRDQVRDGGPTARHLQQQLQAQLRSALAAVYPESATAGTVAEEWRVDRDAVLVAPTRWSDRPSVTTPDPRLMLAGDVLRCDLPVALMERAATTGFQAANALLAGWGVRGHDLWTVPRRSRQRWPGRLRALTGLVQPGNSPRRRSS
jgi:isorenieratene synthase